VAATRAQDLLICIGNPRVLRYIYREREGARDIDVQIYVYIIIYIAFQRGHDARASIAHRDRQPARAPVYIYTYI